MARQSKPKTTETSTENKSVPVSTPVVVAAPTPVVEEKTKKVRAPKVDAAAVAAPVSTPVPAPTTAPVVEAKAEEVAVPEVETHLAKQSDEFLCKLQQIGVLISSLKTEYRALEKSWNRELKTAQKQSSKRKRKSGNRSPSGFVKPTKISDELASFLNKEKGSEMARTEVTREINAYIRENKLQAKENGRKIIPDAKLASLLKLKKTDELTYFNLQKYMSPHFEKAVKPTVTA